MLSKLKDFGSKVVALAKAHPVLFLLLLLVVAVFASAPFLALYRKARALPGLSALPVK